jgi:putative hydrolase of the HAD superfamily
MIDWRIYETILLDMDGTILDLAYDNYFWLELVPRVLARERGTEPAAVMEELLGHFHRVQGTLDWYCLDYWTRTLDLDMRALKSASSHRVRYLPGAEAFLQRLRGSGKPMALLTNAHGTTLEIKRGVTGLGRWFDTFVSSHDYGTPKESADFWPAAQAALGFDPAHTLFIDDSLAVLDAAADFGLAGVLAIRQPDSRVPARDMARHASITGLRELA